jgi:hypothetical protein
MNGLGERLVFRAFAQRDIEVAGRQSDFDSTVDGDRSLPLEQESTAEIDTVSRLEIGEPSEWR